MKDTWILWALAGLLALSIGGILFGCGCATKEDSGMTARTALGVVKILCPPEITVGDCLAKVEAFLPLESGDAGAE